MKNDFKHMQAAHCENGVTTNLLGAAGATELTEPLVFGIESGLFFIYIPFMKVNKGPAFAYRTMAGTYLSKEPARPWGIPVFPQKNLLTRRNHKRSWKNCIGNGQP